MSVRILLDHAMMRLDRNLYDPSTVLVRAHRHGDIARIFKGEELIDRPDRRYRFRAFISHERISWAFGREIIDKLFNANLPVPSVGRRKAYAETDAALAGFKDKRPWPSRAPVLRGDWKAIAADPEHEADIPFDRPGWLRPSDLTFGLLPAQMEDKWFVFYESPWLYLHRSWTGFPVARFRMDSPRLEARINLDPAHNSADLDTQVSHALGALAILHGVVLDTGGDPLSQWHAYGQAILGAGPAFGVDPKRMVASKPA